MTRARYIMIGGFLGAGKSTAVGRLARRLADEGRPPGLILNDQGGGLVDGANLRSRGFAVEEIAGGCFCCRFDSLAAAAESLARTAAPSVFIAEPVGSCTDLAATVAYPLRRLYGENYEIAPLSAVVDPHRAARVLGLAEGRGFSPKVAYIYRKQLEETDIVVLNKIDLLDAPFRARLREALEREFPKAEVLEVSARTGEGLDVWFDRLLNGEMPAGTAMEVDYDLYAEGEALLGWLNSTHRLSAPEGIDGNRLLADLAGALRRRLDAAGAEIAHLKMTLLPEPPGLAGEAGSVSLVRGGGVPEATLELAAPVSAGTLIVNLRAETAPEVLREAVEAETAAAGNLETEHLEAFRPGRPVPTHRLARIGEGFAEA